MFRIATRAALPLRAAVRQQARAASTAPKADAGFFKTWVIGMPVDVYPLATIVGIACSGSCYMIYKHLVEDSRRGELRLLPTSMQ